MWASGGVRINFMICRRKPVIASNTTSAERSRLQQRLQAFFRRTYNGDFQL